MDLPTLLPENQIHLFSYYWEGEIRSGMTLQGRLYALLDCFPENRRIVAYETGCQLAENHDVVITVGKDTQNYYSLWISLCPSTSEVLSAYSGSGRCTVKARRASATVSSPATHRRRAAQRLSVA